MRIVYSSCEPSELWTSHTELIFKLHENMDFLVPDRFLHTPHITTAHHRCAATTTHRFPATSSHLSLGNLSTHPHTQLHTTIHTHRHHIDTITAHLHQFSDQLPPLQQHVAVDPFHLPCCCRLSTTPPPISSSLQHLHSMTTRSQPPATNDLSTITNTLQQSPNTDHLF